MVAQEPPHAGIPEQHMEITVPIKPAVAQGFNYPQPSAPPPPSAPPAPEDDLSNVTDMAFPRTLAETLEWARLAIHADRVDRDVEKAIKLYDGSVIGFLNYESSESNPQLRMQYRPYVKQYGERSEAIKLNLKNMRARARAAVIEAERQERRAANTSSSSSVPTSGPTSVTQTQATRATTPPPRQYGWDGTSFSGIRRGQYDSAVAAFENAKVAEARGEIQKARDLYTESATHFNEFQKVCCSYIFCGVIFVLI